MSDLIDPIDKSRPAKLLETPTEGVSMSPPFWILPILQMCTFALLTNKHKKFNKYCKRQDNRKFKKIVFKVSQNSHDNMKERRSGRLNISVTSQVD